MYKHFFKRFLDLVLSLSALIILLPLYLIIAILVRIKMGSPVLFGQERVGKYAKMFKMYKFRTMTDKRDECGKLLDEKYRLNKFGIALRSFSLDELPEIFLILKGDMSIVGPRPLPTYDEPFFLPSERVRHNVRGGLLPPDVLSGNPNVTWEEQFKYEVDYANNVSLLLDIKIIIATFKILFRRVKTDYGIDSRPHLKDYRANMKIE
jgi:undecaprenyl phosphate N,N'-diacetylbacillosamine 1-phosphate transferase